MFPKICDYGFSRAFELKKNRTAGADEKDYGGKTEDMEKIDRVQADIAPVGVLEGHLRSGLSGVAAIDALAVIRGLLRALLAFGLLPIASGQSEQRKEQQDQPHGILQSDVGRALFGRSCRADARDK